MNTGISKAFGLKNMCKGKKGHNGLSRAQMLTSSCIVKTWRQIFVTQPWKWSPWSVWPRPSSRAPDGLPVRNPDPASLPPSLPPQDERSGCCPRDRPGSGGWKRTHRRSRASCTGWRRIKWTHDTYEWLRGTIRSKLDWPSRWAGRKLSQIKVSWYLFPTFEPLPA